MASKKIAFMLLVISHIANNEATENPENGWLLYKDKIYIKLFPNLLTYKDAAAFCSRQGDEGSLVNILESDLQHLLTNYSKGVGKTIWLGAKYDKDEFFWQDGSPLTYKNWGKGYPKEVTDKDACIEMQPFVTWILSDRLQGNWAHTSCRKKNMVMCQKKIKWTLTDAISEILKMQKKLESVEAKLATVESQLEEVNSSVVPVGSIYIEYYNQPSPTALWKSFTWQDISDSYAGLFFRAYGDGSEYWGITQSECAPRITQMEYMAGEDLDVKNPLNFTLGGWSQYGLGGEFFFPGTAFWEGLRFYTQDCEVRPKNQAIRIWRRMA